MAITTNERAGILELVVLMFDAAPGAAILSDIVSIYEGPAGRSLSALATVLGNTGVFQTLHPNFESAEEFAADILQPLGLAADSAANDWVIAQYNAGATKSAILFATWDFLDDLPATAASQYLNARAIMENKAEVSEYYSVILARNSGSIAVLQDVLIGVTADAATVDAAIADLVEDAATGPLLTTGADVLAIPGRAATTITGLVDGNADGSTSDGTFNAGDRITGNGSTHVDVTVLEGGEAGFVRLENIASVDISAATGAAVSFNAAGWTNVGIVRLNDGVDGLGVQLNNLRAGVDLAVADVTGAIAAEYDTDAGNLSVLLRNNDEGGSGGSIQVEADGTVEVDMAASMTAELTNTTGVALGDITVNGGDRGVFTALFDAADDMSFALANVELGNESVIAVGFEAVDGNADAGNITLEAGDESSVTARVDEVTGDATVGDVELTVGNESDAALQFRLNAGDVQAGAISFAGGHEVSLGVEVTLGAASTGANVTLGDISFEAGNTASIDAGLAGFAGAGDLTLGTVTALAGESADIALSAFAFADAAIGDVSLEGASASNIEVSIGGLSGALTANNVTASAGAESLVAMSVAGVAGGIVLQDVSLTAGDSSSVALSLSGATADVDAGNIGTIAGESSDVTVIVQAAGHLSVGNVTQAAGSGSATGATLAITEAGGDLIVGDVGILLGDEGRASFNAVNTAEFVGVFTAGDVAAEAGDDSVLSVNLIHTASVSASAEATGPAVGDMTVGDITMTVGSASSIEADADALATVLYGGKGDDIDTGDRIIGDVALTVGSGFVSGTLENHASARFIGVGFATAGMGNADIGNIALAGGDFANLGATVGAILVGEDGAMGDGSIGRVSFTGGEGAIIDFDAYWGAFNAGSVGSFESGVFEIDLAQDAVVAIDVIHGGVMGTVGQVGDFNVGGAQATLGDNAQVRFGVREFASHAGLASDAEGDYTVGDIGIAVSATSTDDQSGGSLIDVELVKRSAGLIAAGGDFTVGDVVLSAGNGAAIDLDISYSGAYDGMGEVSIGTIGLEAGDDAENVTATVLIRNTEAGDFDSVEIGGVDVMLGAGSAAVVDVNLLHGGKGGDFADISLGDLTLAIGEGSQATVMLVTTMTADASVGDYSVGDVTLNLGKNAVVDLESLDVDADALGNVSIGGFDAVLGEGASAAFDIDLGSDTKAGALSAGEVEAVLGEAAELDYSIDLAAAGAIGSAAFGNWDLTLGEGATARQSVRIASAGGAVGNVALGDVAFDLGVDASLEPAGLAVIAAGAIGTVSAGDITATVADGASGSFLLQSNAGGNAGHMIVGDVHLAIEDVDGDIGGSFELTAGVQGGANNANLTVGNVTLALDGAADADAVQVFLNADGNIAVGNLTVSGEGKFSFSALAASEANTSVLALNAGGTKTIGNVDFSGFTGNANLDLSWSASGAGSITGGAGADSIRGNAGANVITGGKGVDQIDISQGGSDTIVTSQGDSGKVAGSFDTVTGFAAGALVSAVLTGGDRLDFNLVAGSAGNYVERAENFTTTAQFLANAGDALNSTVRYFVQDNGTDTYVAVNFGSGEADVVIVLAGVADATSLQFQNFVA